MNSENMSHEANRLTETYQRWQSCAVEGAQNLGRVTDDFVRENPWWSIGAVALAALAVGMLLAQSMRRS